MGVSPMSGTGILPVSPRGVSPLALLLFLIHGSHPIYVPNTMRNSSCRQRWIYRFFANGRDTRKAASLEMPPMPYGIAAALGALPSVALSSTAVLRIVTVMPLAIKR